MPSLPHPARALPALALLLVAACSSGSPVTSPESGLIGVAVGGTAGGVTSARERNAVRVRACDGPASSLPAVLAARLPPPPNPSAPTGGFTIDDYLSALARRAPGGFAGVFYDNGGTQPVLLLVDPSRAVEAKAALAGQVPNFDVAAAEVRAARWDFAQLYDWYRYLRAQGVWAGGTGLTLSDIDERANRLYFGAADATARDRLAERLAAMDELPCGLVMVGIEPVATLAR